MSCCEGVLKYLLVFFTVTFFVTGFVLVLIGALHLSHISHFSATLTQVARNLEGPHLLVMILGTLILFITFMGCWGTIKEDRHMLFTFALCVLIIFFCQISLGVYVLVNRNEGELLILDGLEKDFERLDEPDIEVHFKDMEKDMQCCGVRGTGDYLKYSLKIPLSCCEDRVECKKNPNVYFNRGCAKAISDFAKRAIDVLGSVAVGLSFIEVMGASFALKFTINYQSQ